MHCKKCSTQIKPGNKWCIECGAVVEQNDVAATCTGCGDKMPGNLKFCTNCGTKKADSVQQSYPAQTDQPKAVETPPVVPSHIPTPPVSPMPASTPVSPAPAPTVTHTPTPVSAAPPTTVAHTPPPPPTTTHAPPPPPTTTHAPTPVPPTSTPTVAHTPPPTAQYAPPSASTMPTQPSYRSHTPPPPPPPAPDAQKTSKKQSGNANGSNRLLLIVASIIGVVVIAGIVSVIAILSNMDAPADAEEAKLMAYEEAGATRDGYEVLSGAQIFEKNRDAVIIIRTDLGNGFIATGSGFIVCSSGVAVTNHHVMYGALSAYAILYDGTEFPITGYYSYDIGNDLAVIHVDGGRFQFDYATLGDSDATRVGESVFAIGGPEWEPITFTPGTISRIAYDPVSFGIYTISGMFQSTAAIYQGNSGGPLVNDRGEVIGVNAATHMVRASVQMAVPVNRVQLPATDAVVRSFPVGTGVGELPAPPQHTPGDVYYYVRFPFIPDFMSVSQHGTFFFSGTPADLGFVRGTAMHDYYIYLYAYEVSTQHAATELEAFGLALAASGFNFQNVVTFDDDESWTYYFHPTQNYSVSIAKMVEGMFTFFVVAVGEGDVYDRFYHGGDSADGEPQPVAQSELVGSWSCGCMVIHYFADGTGQVDSLDEDGTVIFSHAFDWITENGFLTYLSGPFEEATWEYRIVNDGQTVRFFAEGEDGEEIIVSFDRVD